MKNLKSTLLYLTIQVSIKIFNEHSYNEGIKGGNNVCNCFTQHSL